MFGRTPTRHDTHGCCGSNSRPARSEGSGEVERQLREKARHHDAVTKAKRQVVELIRSTPGQTLGELRDAVIRQGIRVDNVAPSRLIHKLARDEEVYVERTPEGKRWYAKPNEEKKGKRRGR